MFCYPEEQKVWFFGFDVAKLGQKLLLRIAIKFESINVLPLGEIFSEKILSYQDIVY